MTSPPDNSRKIDKDRTFWSPILVFFLGTPFAALNWWRMGKKQKAIIFLGISVVIYILQMWLQIGPPYPISDRSAYAVISLSLLVGATYSLVLALMVARDIRMFNTSASEPRAVKWAIIFPFFLATVSIGLGIIFGLDYLAQNTKYCRFPRLQDKLYENMLDSRSGLQNTLINHYDAGCGVIWSIESEDNALLNNQTPKPTNRIEYTLVGRQKGNSNSIIVLFQDVELYQEPITQGMIDSAVEKNAHSGSVFEIYLGSNHANFSDHKCTKDMHRYCVIALGYNHILTLFQVSQDEISDSEFEKILADMLHNIDRRINEFDTLN